ncbi:MAG TPA: amidohydrolase family protein [Candidatus Limiplasma sp.]|nr:amidohydrolase family protein [Candidatus Limiplasma sp.]
MEYIDAHAHIYPEVIAAKASQATADFYEMEMRWGGRLDTLLERGKLAGIEKHVVQGVGVTPGRVKGINDYLIRVVAEHPDRLIGFGAMHAGIPDVRAELKRIKAGGLVGVKMHTDFQKVLVDCDAMIEVFKRLADENMPAMLHMGDFRYPYSEPERLARVLRIVPDVKVIAAHFGGWSIWKEAWKVLADFDNVWVDTSSSLYALTPEEGAEIVHRYRPDRVLFATDYPMWDPVEERVRFDTLPLTDTERENIGRYNIEAFFRQFT